MRYTKNTILSIKILLLTPVLFLLSSCCKYIELKPLEVCFDTNSSSQTTNATIITKRAHYLDTVYYSFSNTSICLLLETEFLVDEGTVEILTDKPVPKTVLTNFKRIDRKSCGKVPRYSFEVNGVLRKEREEHTVNIKLK